MKIQEEISGAVERRILTAMITSKSVLGRITSKWDGRLFRSPWSNSLAQLCTDFYKKHSDAPGKAIDSLYESWLESQRDQDAGLKLGEFLAGLGGDYRAVNEDVNPEHVIDLAGKHFREVRQDALLQALEAARQAHDADRVDKLLGAYRKVELGIGAGIDLFLDQEEVKSVFTVDDSDLLVEYPDALGEFFGSDMSRDCFVVFQGTSKVGKSHWLQDIAWRAMLSRKKVAYFEAGDLSKRQVERRFLVRASGIPWESTHKREPFWPCSLEYPTKMSVEPDEKTGKRRGIVTESKTMPFHNKLDFPTAWNACEKVMKTQVRSKQPYFKLSVHPNSTLTVDTIRSVLDGYAIDDWYADCVAEGSLVLTNHGLIPIERVSRDDKLWDGCDWISHDGPIYKGVKNVITHSGLTATPDHKVWTDEGWRTLESCAYMGLRIASTGKGRSNLRIGEDYITHYTHQGIQISQVESRIHRKTGVRLCEVCKMWCGKVGDVSKHQTRHCQRMSQMSSAKEISKRILAESRGSSAAVPKSKKQCLALLRREGNRISISLCNGGMCMDSGEFRNALGRDAVRSNRQRWALRGWQYSMVYSCAEHLTHEKESTNSKNAQISSSISSCDLCGQHLVGIFQMGNDCRANSRKVESFAPEMRKSKVWDILNAGPFHRFTVQGVLAHNCIVLDYSDIMAAPTGTRDERDAINTTWKQLRRLSQEYHNLVVTATQADADAYNQETQTRKNFSGDRRKNDHVTAIYGINQTDDEKEHGVCRLNVLGRREGEYVGRRCIHVAQCLALGRPSVLSSF